MRARALTTSIVSVLCLAAFAVPASAATRQATTPAPAPAPVAGDTAGGASYDQATAPTPVMPSGRIIDGKAYPPADAPAEVQQAIWSANEIVGKPYKYGGGHARVVDTGYDCSGTVSYALLGGDLMDGTPLDSGSFMKWGESGAGSWVTVYTNPGHAFVVIAGMRLDTSAAGDPSGAKGPRWRPVLRSTKGFVARHPVGF
ncbi:hypothetical protein DSM104329_04288 [Capillimicrobium parvum]|uniref:NlpC/P60 domain-containing protein n=1 Tax=Capillimicrobium parvum TaxID=2884022 RepID=A0A9E6Y1G0_9ACTN|nr:hypothetical protein DSM104329_04288 [Capillimicrobium parvum]